MKDAHANRERARRPEQKRHAAKTQVDVAVPPREPADRKTTTIDDWAASLDAPEPQLARFDAAIAGLRDAVSSASSQPALQFETSGVGARTADAQAIAHRGLAGAAAPLPFHARIQEAFGRHDVSRVRAAIGGPAARANRDLAASGYTMGEAVAFSRAPDLRLAAHEAAHVIQQRGGVSLMGGIGSRGDVYERHADEVAAAVVSGHSAEGLLDRFAGTGAASRGTAAAIQRDPEPPGQASTQQTQQTEEPPSADAIRDGVQTAVVTFLGYRWAVTWPDQAGIALRAGGRRTVALLSVARTVFGQGSIDGVQRALASGLREHALQYVLGRGLGVLVDIATMDYVRAQLGLNYLPGVAAAIAQARAGEACERVIRYGLAHWGVIERHARLSPNDDIVELRHGLERNTFYAALRLRSRNLAPVARIIREAGDAPLTDELIERLRPNDLAEALLYAAREVRLQEQQATRNDQAAAPDLAPDGMPHPFPMTVTGPPRSIAGGTATFAADVRPGDEQLNPRGQQEGVGRRVLEEARTIQRASYRWELIDLSALVARSTEGAMQAGREGLALRGGGRELGQMDAHLRNAGNEFRNWAHDFQNSWQAAGSTNQERAAAVLRMFGPVPTPAITARQQEQQVHVLNMLLGVLTLAGTTVRQGLRLAWHALTDDVNEQSVPVPTERGIYGIRCVMQPKRIDGRPSRHPSIAAKILQVHTADELAHQAMNPMEAQFEELLQSERDPARRRLLEQALEQLRSAPETPAMDVLQRQLDELRRHQATLRQGSTEWTRDAEHIAALESQLGLARGQLAQVTNGGRQVLTPYAAHVDEETGQMTRMRVQMSVGRATPTGPWEVRISDVTIAAMSEMQSASDADLTRAVDLAFDRVRHGNVYPRGTIRVRFPQVLIDLGLPANHREHSYVCEPVGIPLLRAQLQRLAEDAGYLAFIGVPGAGVAAMGLGASSAVMNMAARARAGRLHMDGETASDLMNILPIITSRIPLPSLSGRFRLLRQGGRIIIQGVRLAGEVGPALYPLITIPMHLADQIREIEEAVARGELDPSLGRERIAALLASQGANMLMAGHGLAEHAGNALEPGVPTVRETSTNEPRTNTTETTGTQEPTGTTEPNGTREGQTGTREPQGTRTSTPRTNDPNGTRTPATPNGAREPNGQTEGQGGARTPAREPTPQEQAAVPRTQGLEPPRFGAPTAEVEAFIARANPRDILQWWWGLGNWATRMRVEAGRLSPEAQAKVHAARMELYREAEARSGVRGTLSGSQGLGSDVDPTFSGPRTLEDTQRYAAAMEQAIRERGLDPTGWREILGLNPYTDPQLQRFAINDRVNGQLTPEAQAARSRLLSREQEIVELNHRNRLMNEDPSGRLWREFVEREVARVTSEHPGDTGETSPGQLLRNFYDRVNDAAALYDTRLLNAARRINPNATLEWLRSPDGFLTQRQARAALLAETQAELQNRISAGERTAGPGRNGEPAGQNMSVEARERILQSTQDVKALEEEAYQPSAIDSVVGDQQQGHQNRLEAGQQPLAMRDMEPQARMNALVDSLNMLEEHLEQVTAMMEAVAERAPTMTRTQLNEAIVNAMKPIAKYIARALIEARELGMPLPARFRLLNDLSRMLRARQGETTGTPRSGGATMTVAEGETIVSDANNLGVMENGNLRFGDFLGEVGQATRAMRSSVNNRRALDPALRDAMVPDPGSRLRAASPSEPTSTPDNRRPPGLRNRLPDSPQTQNSNAPPGVQTRGPVRCTDRSGQPSGNGCQP